MKILAALFLFLTSCASLDQKGSCLISGGIDTPCKPFRAGMIQLNKELDRVKPLGAVDEGGWVVSGNILVGSSYSDWVQGVSLKNKETVWWLKTDSPVASPLAIFGEHVIVGLRDGSVLKVNAKTGKLIWKQRLGRFVSREPVLSGTNLLVMTVDQKLFSLDFNSGKTSWIYNAGLPSGLVLRGASKQIGRAHV